MRKKTDVTIIVIARNDWPQVERCLKSLMRQPGLTTEIVLLNDGSDDGASKSIKQFASSNKGIKLFEQKYKGLANSRNKAIRQIQGTYTLFVNQDQELLPYSLQLAYRAAAGSGADVLQLSYMLRDEANHKRQRMVRMPKAGDRPNGGEYIKAIGGRMQLATGNYANMIRSEYLKEHLMRFDPRLSDPDFDFFARAVIGAERVETTPHPLFITPLVHETDIEPSDDPVKTTALELEYVRRNFNEFAENNYLSGERIKAMRYVRFMHMLETERGLLAKALQPKDFNKWVHDTRRYVLAFGGWKHPARIMQRLGLKPVDVRPTKSNKNNTRHNADKTDA